VNDLVSCPVGQWGISAFSGDGQYLAVSAADEVPKVLRLPEVASAQTMERPKTQQFWLRYLEFSSNSQYLLAHASVSEAKGTEEEEGEWEEWAWKSATFIWRVRDGKLVSIFPTRVDGFAFSPSARQGVFVRRVGEELLSEAYEDYRVAEVVLWRAKTAKVVKAFLAGVEPLLRGHYLDLGGHYLVSFTKDGSLLAIGGSAFPRGQSSRGGPKIAQGKTSESAVKVWDTFNTRLLAEFRSGREIVGVKLSPDGKYLALLDEDGRLVFWQLAKVK
jgi:WD40 repeat protein